MALGEYAVRYKAEIMLCERRYFDDTAIKKQSVAELAKIKFQVKVAGEAAYYCEYR